ncbi:MAG: radical SAM protein, partial [Thermodesulfobacteriota bacterium]
MHNGSFAEMEIGTIQKSKAAKVEIALVYPNRYHVGMSNLGFQTAYALFNDIDDVKCERAFLPEPGGDSRADIKTIESGRRISEFDIIAFSVSYENDYPNLLAILDQGGFPLQSAERNFPHPLVVAGGVACFLNPEPIASFIDCIFIGEAEEMIPPFLECVLTAAPDSASEKESLLATIAREVPGAYVPCFYKISYHPDGTIQGFKTTIDVPDRIRRVFSKNLSLHETHSHVLTPNTAFGSTFLVEIGRGCTHGCRFCAAGYVYRPPRFRTGRDLEKTVEKRDSRIDKIGIVGASISDCADIDPLCGFILSKGLHLGFSSLRADALTHSLLEALKKNKTRTATIAPDAGSERMRSVINKGMTEPDILNAATRLMEIGILNLKLYFMIG